MNIRRPQVYYLNRTLICVICLLAIGSLFVPVVNSLHLVVDILVRTYLIFLGTVMAHESVHGHLGRTRRANFWWGRIALLPSMVPFTNFRRTHQLHHAFTNVPDKDPDHFMKSRNLLELALRAIAMPHHWFFWLRKRGRLKSADLLELFATGGVLHGGTFNAQPVTMAAMVATQAALVPEQYEAASRRGVRLRPLEACSPAAAH